MCDIFFLYFGFSLPKVHSLLRCSWSGSFQRGEYFKWIFAGDGVLFGPKKLPLERVINFVLAKARVSISYARVSAGKCIEAGTYPNHGWGTLTGNQYEEEYYVPEEEAEE